MDTIKNLIKSKRNLAGLMLAVILLVALPVGLYLVQTRQIFKPKASNATGYFQLHDVNSSSVDTLPGSVNLSLYAQVDGQVLDHLELNVIKVDASNNPLPGATWTDLTANLTGEYCDGETGTGAIDTTSTTGSCQATITDQYNVGDDGRWMYVMDVYYREYYDNDNYNVALWCTGRANGSDEVCPNSSSVVEAGNPDQASGGTTNPGNTNPGDNSQLNLQLGIASGSTCYNGLQLVTLNWDDIAGASRYSVVRENANVPGLAGNTLSNNLTISNYGDSTAPPSTNQSYTVTAWGSNNNQITYETKTIAVPACGGTTTTPGGGGTTGTTGPLVITATQTSTCVASGFATINFSWNAITGAQSYIVKVDSTSSVSTLTNSNFSALAGSHVITVTPFSGANGSGAQIGTPGSKTVVVSCTGSGGTTNPGGGTGVTSCAITGSSTGIVGQSISYSMSGVNCASGAQCTFNVNGPSGNTQLYGAAASFVPTLPGTYSVSGSATVTSPTYNTVQCSGTSTNVTATTGGGGGTTPGTGGNTGTLNCNTAASCGGACVPIAANTCSGGNGRASNCVYTQSTLSATCNQVAAPDQVCNAGDQCSSGNSCQNGQCISTQTTSSTPPNNGGSSIPPTSTNPTLVKLANKGSFTSCVDALVNSNETFNLNGQTSIDVSHNLADNVPGVKTICAQFYSNSTPVGPTIEKTIQLVADNSNSCIQNTGDAKINGVRDGAVDLLDFNEWRDEFIYELNHGYGSSSRGADFNCDGKIDLLDFNIWRDAFKAKLGL